MPKQPGLYNEALPQNSKGLECSSAGRMLTYPNPGSQCSGGGSKKIGCSRLSSGPGGRPATAVRVTEREWEDEKEKK